MNGFKCIFFNIMLLVNGESIECLTLSFSISLQRFCMLKKDYMEAFEGIYKEQYETIHRLETNKLRNVAKMFAHLLYTDSVPWSVSHSR